jgi:hypothetical protein
MTFLVYPRAKQLKRDVVCLKEPTSYLQSLSHHLFLECIIKKSW